MERCGNGVFSGQVSETDSLSSTADRPTKFVYFKLNTSGSRNEEIIQVQRPANYIFAVSLGNLINPDRLIDLYRDQIAF